MPFYHCTVLAETVSAAQREELARAITEVHVLTTGAPRQFVNVLFTEYKAGTCFVAGRPDLNALSVISGTIRAGRDRETRARLLTGLSQAWTSITGTSARNLLLGLVEVDATSTMEAGLIMPAPGEEEEWLARHRATLGEVLADE